MPKGQDKHRNKAERKEAVVAIATANPSLSAYEITDEIQKLYPGYTYASVQNALRGAGIKTPWPPKDYPEEKRRRHNSYNMSARPQAEAKPKRSIHRAAVHGYHGRSRRLPSYVEL